MGAVLVSGLPYSQSARNRRLAAKPRCGMEWYTDPSFRWHLCKKFKGHLARHECSCGAQKMRKRASHA